MERLRRLGLAYRVTSGAAVLAGAVSVAWISPAAPWVSSVHAADDPCAVPDALLEDGRLVDAEREYGKLGQIDCATIGIAQVKDHRDDAIRQCSVAARLHEAKLDEESKAAYLAALKIDRQAECAFGGLLALAKPDLVTESWNAARDALPAAMSTLALAVGALLPRAGARDRPGRAPGPAAAAVPAR